MVNTKSCVICGAPLPALKGNWKTCSELHSKELRKKNDREFRFQARMIKSCVDCGYSLRNFHMSKLRCYSCRIEQRKRKLELDRERYANDPAYREQMLKQGRENHLYRYRTDKEYRERKMKQSRESWANSNPAHRKHVLEYQKKRRASPIYNKQQKEYYRWRYDNDPAYRERLQKYQKKMSIILAAAKQLGYIPTGDNKASTILAALRQLGYIPTGDSE